MTLNHKPGIYSLILAVGLLISCKKEVVITALEDMPYEQRLEGIWKLQSVTYSTEFPDPQNPLQTIDINGDGEDVEGLFVLGHDPNELDYSYEFLANISLGNSLPEIPVPIERDGDGTWSATSDESRIFITETDQTSYTFVVLENELNRQVYQTTFEETVMSIFTIEVEVVLTFVR